MEIRNGGVIVSAAGGTSSKNAKTYKLSLPSSWLSEMGINADEKDVQLSYDGTQIIIQKRLPLDAFIEKKQSFGHDLKLISYYNGEQLCTRICADFSDHSLSIENEPVPNLNRAFGVNEAPTWNDFLAFLEERCIPRQREGLRYYLDELSLDEYDPWKIVQHTAGRMAEDQQWLQVEDLT